MTTQPKPSDYTVGDRVNYRSPLFPDGISATVNRIDEFFVHVRFDRDPVRQSFAAYPENLTKISAEPVPPPTVYGLTPAQFRTIFLAATSYFDDWSSGLDDGTYNEETRDDCDELELALAAYDPR
jgi:hypothetical protein